MIQTTDNFVLIIGLPATGKTTLAKQLMENYPEFAVIHTDGYIHDSNGLKQDLYKDLISGQKVIVEGMFGYNLIKDLIVTNNMPDLIIHCVSSTEVRAKRYVERETEFANVMKMDRLYLSIWGTHLRNNHLHNTRILEYES